MRRTSRIEMWQMWDRLNQGLPVTVNNDYILPSHERSSNYPIDPFKQTNDKVMNPADLQQLKQKNKKLLDIALRAMEDIYDYTKNSGFAICISDANGIILEMIGDEEERAFCEYSNFIVGSDWSEEIMGTNAIGLTIKVNQPVQVYGYEHFCKCAALSTCSSSPINSQGELIGVLNITGDYRLANNHTLGMAVAASKAIERELEKSMAYDELERSNALRQSIIESVVEGILVLDGEGRILHINHKMERYLNSGKREALLGQKADKLIRGNERLFERVLSGKPMDGETVMLKLDHEKKRFIINSTPMYGEGGHNKGAVIAFNELHNVVKKIIRSRATITFDDLIGESAGFKRVWEQARMAAETDSSVLLLGESGVGKDLFAQAIHNESKRAREPFIIVNCSAIPRELISSELFGYEDGAFTGARKGGQLGKFELADQGSIFLDEIGEMPLDLQATLLRVLEEKAITRIGGSEVISTNVRLISATNRDLIQAIRDKRFRQDLFFRLNVLTITIPALRERRSDIPLLTEHLIQKISTRLGKPASYVDPTMMDYMLQYDWPGNVRELSNVVERALNLSRSGILTVDYLPNDFLDNAQSEAMDIWEQIPTKDDLEEHLIRNYLAKFTNKTDVAKALGISRSSLYRKMEKYKILT